MKQNRASLPKELIHDYSVSDKELKDLKKKQRQSAEATDSGTYKPHVYYVFNDPAFRQEVLALRSEIETLYYKNISMSLDFESKHMLGVDMEKIKDLADKYCISLDDLGLFADGHFDKGSAYGASMDEYGGLVFGPPGHWGVSYVIGDKTTLKQIQTDWEMIKEYRAMFSGATNTKLKSPQNTQLLYAIFKARNFQHKSFTQIYKDYEQGAIGDFKIKNSGQYNSKDELERYYNGAKPTIKTTPLSLPLKPR